MGSAAAPHVAFPAEHLAFPREIGNAIKIRLKVGLRWAGAVIWFAFLAVVFLHLREACARWQEKEKNKLCVYLAEMICW